MLIIDGVKYSLWIPQDEMREFHPVVKKYSKEIFGDNSVYFDVAINLKSISGLGSKPDGLVLNLEKNEWYLVEIELSKHSPYDHIVNQLSRFINGIDNANTKNQVVDIIDNELESNKLRSCIEEKVTGDVHRWLTKLIFKTPKIIVVIEEKTQEVTDACKLLMKNYETTILELKTYIRQDAPTVRAYLIESLFEEKRMVQVHQGKPRLEPESQKNWEKELIWVDEDVKKVVNQLSNLILGLEGVTGEIHTRNYFFYYNKPGLKSHFAVFMLRKKELVVRIAIEPQTFKDPEKLLKEKIYRWFFGKGRGQEREFRISQSEQIDYAMKMIKQSYDCIKK